MDAAHFSILLNSLKREIESNISTLQRLQGSFRPSRYTNTFCRRHESRFDWDIDRQMKKVTNGYYWNSWKPTALLEAVGLGSMTVRKRNCWKEGTNGASGEYDKEKKAKLDELYKQKEQARREALQCLKKPLRGTFADWAAHYWQSLKNT